ncbi:right-handed parallel beta-helix repeat-containing protein [Myxococcota bacterium]|nr:right-handed parallel beta-helix repeat-containing protein [Myxococcota bacterium]
MTAALLPACASTSTKPAEPEAPVILIHAPKVFVSPAGDDRSPGTEAQPLRTITFAVRHSDATEVVLLPGDLVEPTIDVARGVELFAVDEGTRVLGLLRVTGAKGVVLRDLELLGGVEITRRSDVKLTKSKLAGARPTTITIDQSVVAIRDVELTCGAEACLAASSSTISVVQARLDAPASKRALRVETSSVSGRALTISGADINQVLATRHARVTIEDSTFTGARGSAIASVDGASVVLDRATITDAARFGVLVESASAAIRRVLVQPTKGFGVGVAGGTVEVTNTIFESSSDGAMTIAAHAGRPSKVTISGGMIRHGRKPGILLAEGELVVDGAHFVGSGSRDERADAITASGLDAVLDVRSARIDGPAGFGISMTNGAQGTITATIARARAGGIYVEDALGAPVVIRGTRIEACAAGSGVVVLDSTDVKVSNVAITDCPEAGILAGLGSVLEIDDAKLTKNGQYAVAAFGGTTISLHAVRASGGRWVTFASCGDGSRIEDRGDNKLVGKTATCP